MQVEGHTSRRARGFLVGAVLLVAGAGWLAWAWSPEPVRVDEGGSESGAVAQTPPNAAIVGASESGHAEEREGGERTTSSPPRSVSPHQPPTAAEVSARAERIPTPHPMSLDQARPPLEDGPLRELKQRFATESRSTESSALEADLRTTLTNVNIPAALIDGIECRRTICKIEMLWTPERYLGYVVASGNLRQRYSPHFATAPAAALTSDGSHPVTHYLEASATTR